MKEYLISYLILSYLIGIGISVKFFILNNPLGGVIVFLLSPIIVPIKIGLNLMEE